MPSQSHCSTRNLLPGTGSRRRTGGLLLLLLLLLCGAQPSVSQNATPIAPVSNGHRGKHLSAKDDIDSIGSRNIGKRGVGDWYSLEQEQNMGREYAKAIDRTTTLLKDPLVNDYVNGIAQKIIRNSDAKVAFTIKVIDSDDVNAFALPGGFMYVNTGLLLATQNEAELAGVMAHEIAHVAARHATRQMTRQKMFDFASLPLIFVGGGVGMVLQTAASVAKPLELNKFSRSFEAEADYLGTEYLYKAGYDPTALISFFERMDTMRRANPGKAAKVAKVFSTHPETSSRIRKLQRELAAVLPPRDSYEVSTSVFDEVIAHLIEIQKAGAASSHSHKPILRRQVSIQGSPTGE